MLFELAAPFLAAAAVPPLAPLSTVLVSTPLMTTPLMLVMDLPPVTTLLETMLATTLAVTTVLKVTTLYVKVTTLYLKMAWLMQPLLLGGGLHSSIFPEGLKFAPA